MYRPDLRGLRKARADTALALDGLRIAHASDVGTTVLVVVDELASNAVVHARTPFSVGLLAMPTGVRVEVADLAPEFVLDRCTAHQDGPPERRHQLGLFLVHRVSADWGVRRDQHGKTVWAVVDYGRHLP